MKKPLYIFFDTILNMPFMPSAINHYGDVRHTYVAFTKEGKAKIGETWLMPDSFKIYECSGGILKQIKSKKARERVLKQIWLGMPIQTPEHAAQANWPKF